MPGGGGSEPNDNTLAVQQPQTTLNIASDNSQFLDDPELAKSSSYGLEYLGITFIFLGIMYFLYIKFKN